MRFESLLHDECLPSTTNAFLPQQVPSFHDMYNMGKSEGVARINMTGIPVDSRISPCRQDVVHGERHLGFVIHIIWACLHVADTINSRFTTFLPSLEVLFNMFAAAGLEFCPGLFDVLQATTPPPLSWFESLSGTAPWKTWGVYVLVLKKQFHPAYLYIGSGTGATCGLRARLGQYKTAVSSSRQLTLAKYIPYNVKKALLDGYTITHVAVLVSCPIPSVADMPRFRALILALEATFSCIFWTLRCRKKCFGFGNIHLWPRDMFEWDGLCSHNPLEEDIPGDKDLTGEQLERFAIIRMEKARAYDRLYGKLVRLNPTSRDLKRRQRNRARQRCLDRARYQAAVAGKKYHCSICDVSCRDAASLRRHNDSERHQIKVIHGSNGFHCAICDVTFRFKSAYEVHLQSKGHRHKEAGVEVPLGRWHCALCQLNFSWESALKNHLTTKTHLKKAGEPPPSERFSCEVCNFSCKCKSQLRNHQATGRHLRKVAELDLLEPPRSPVAPRPVFRCDVCDKSFEFESKLRLHNVSGSHTKKMAELGLVVEEPRLTKGEDSYHCTACNKFFTYPSQMKIHQTSKAHEKKMAEQLLLGEPAPAGGAGSPI